MDDNLLRKLTGKAQSDQQEAGIDQMARVYALFYSELIAQNVPDSLARALVRDWSYLQLCKAFWPDTPPPMGKGEE